jgi:hypothetical protein
MNRVKVRSNGAHRSTLLAAPVAALLTALSPGVMSACLSDGMDAVPSVLAERATVPARYHELTVDEFLRKFPPERGKASERAIDSDGVAATQQIGITLTGYLLGVKPADSANCGDDNARLWVGGIQPTSPVAAKTLRSYAVVTEITPLWQERHPGWSSGLLNSLAAEGATVRISGWMLHNAAQSRQVWRTRGTLWELHPITKIEVLRGGEWQEL